jgi:hypothetical protein
MEAEVAEAHEQRVGGDHADAPYSPPSTLGFPWAILGGSGGGFRNSPSACAAWPIPSSASLSQSTLRTHVALVRMVGDSKSVSGT